MQYHNDLNVFQYSLAFISVKMSFVSALLMNTDNTQKQFNKLSSLN